MLTFSLAAGKLRVFLEPYIFTKNVKTHTTLEELSIEGK